MPKSCWPVSKGVLRVVFVDQHHAFDGVGCVVERPEDFQQVAAYGLVADQFAQQGFACEVAVQPPQVAELRAGAGAVRLVGFAVHAREECVADLRTGETAVDAVFRHRFFRDLFPGAPCAKPLRIAVAGVCTADPRQEQHECREPFHLPGRITALRAVPRATRRATRNRRAGSGSSLPWRSSRRCRS